MQRTVRLLAFGVLGFVAAPACSDSFGIDDVFGIWNTTSINGYPVPGTVVYEAVSYDTEYVRWVFYDGERCTLTQEVDGLIETFDACDYTVNLEQETITISFLFETWDGRLDGDTMVLTDPADVIWILRRQ
ncbi:MAG: hypothetical protein JSW71_17720 [Gemmatimonadota bacterium]|nr:MAG: hypothetical protein JSW71_17720 [Gemmatimonadota bacterium]